MNATYLAALILRRCGRIPADHADVEACRDIVRRCDDALVYAQASGELHKAIANAPTADLREMYVEAHDALTLRYLNANIVKAETDEDRKPFEVIRDRILAR